MATLIDTGAPDDSRRRDYHLPRRRLNFLRFIPRPGRFPTFFPTSGAGNHRTTTDYDEPIQLVQSRGWVRLRPLRMKRERHFPIHFRHCVRSRNPVVGFALRFAPCFRGCECRSAPGTGHLRFYCPGNESEDFATEPTPAAKRAQMTASESVPRLVPTKEGRASDPRRARSPSRGQGRPRTTNYQSGRALPSSSSKLPDRGSYPDTRVRPN